MMNLKKKSIYNKRQKKNLKSNAGHEIEITLQKDKHKKKK